MPVHLTSRPLTTPDPVVDGEVPGVARGEVLHRDTFEVPGCSETLPGVPKLRIAGGERQRSEEGKLCKDGEGQASEGKGSSGVH